MRLVIEHSEYVEMRRRAVPRQARGNSLQERKVIGGVERPAFAGKPGTGEISVSAGKRERLLRMNGVTCSRSLARVASRAAVAKASTVITSQSRPSGQVGGSTFEAYVAPVVTRNRIVCATTAGSSSGQSPVMRTTTSAPDAAIAPA